MRSIHANPELTRLAERIYSHAGDDLGMTLPEVRFFILDPIEFAALLEKNVYPTSPANIWEGKRMLKKRRRIAQGQESALYYEVVQTGNPSYAYLNETNSELTQASVMAHVLGHCEFSELNVLLDSDVDRTEQVMYLVRKVDLARSQMGERRYIDYWNACESMIPLISPNAQFNLERSVELEHRRAGSGAKRDTLAEPAPAPSLLNPVSSSLNELFSGDPVEPIATAERKRAKAENLSRRGYRLRTPCQDVAGFLRAHAPASNSERTILDYFYTSHMHQDFVMRTQIMNEGWAMYWEKKIMLHLFEEHQISGVIDYSRVFSGVCYPRPYYQRNPYHLGYHLWQHIEEEFRTGRLSLEYREEPMMDVRDTWNKPSDRDPHEYMRHLVRTITDYEFLRRYLTADLVEKYHLNRIPRSHGAALGIREDDVIRADQDWYWIDPNPIPGEMLDFFTHFGRPRIYAIDDDFMDGGLLLYHRDDGRALRSDWIKPTLNNLKAIWKAPVYLLSQKSLHGYRAGKYEQQQVECPTFDMVRARMADDKKPFDLE